jgi:outer membrane protein TolC
VTVVTIVVGVLLLGAPGAPSLQQPPPLPVDPVLPPEGLFEPGETGVSPTPGAEPLTLNQAIALALRQNPGIRAALDGLSESHFREDASRAAFHPQVVPSYQHAPSNQSFSLDVSQKLPWSGGTLTALGTLTSYPLSVGLDRSSEAHLILSQPLLKGFGPNATYFDLQNSERAREGQERSTDIQRQGVAVEVTSAFYQVVRQRQLLSVSRQSLRRSEGLKKASEARMKVGLASKLDVFRAELQADQAQAATVAAESGLETALEQFRILLGLSPDTPVEPEAIVLKEDLAADEPPLPELLSRARAKRLELRESRDQVRDGERAAGIARQNLLPDLTLNLDVSQLGFGSTFSESFHQADRSVNLYLSTSYPLERTQDRAGAAIAQVEVDSRKRKADELDREIDAEVRAAYRNLDRIRKSVELQRKGVDLATQQRRLATLRYQRGLASNFDVVDAETSLVAARTTLVGLLTEYQVARVQLLKSTGELDPRKDFPE